MAIEFNDNIHVKINRPTDFRFGPFNDIAQANATIPIAQRYHGLIFGVYTNPGNIATSDITLYYYWNGLTNSDIKELGGKPPVDGEYANQAAMIAAQGTQTAQYIYYDNTSYWEYLGTTNGNISDYREIGGLPELYESITFAQLQTLISGSSLQPGKLYLINDFQTIHRIINTTTINTGPIEPLISVATSTTTLSRAARSITYPNDEIQIDWTNVICEDGVTPRKGLITYRIDTVRNVSTYFDFRAWKVRRWQFPGFDHETGFVATGPNAITLTLTWSANMNASYLTVYRKWEIKFPAGLTHSAGAINLTITKGAFSYTRPLLSGYTMLNNWTANQLAGLVGPIIYSPAVDSFILMNLFDIGAGQAGYSIATVSTPYTIGNAMSIAPGVSFGDFDTFYIYTNSASIGNVHLGPGCTNNFFISPVYNFTMGGYSSNNTFIGQVASSTLGGESNNNLFLGGLNWSDVGAEFGSNVIGWDANYFSIEAYSINNSFLPGGFNFNAPHTYFWSSTVYMFGWGYMFLGNAVEGSFFGITGSTRADLLFEKEINSSIIGLFNGDNITFERALNSQYIHAKPVATNLLESLNIATLPTPNGAVTPIGRDSVGTIVTYTPPAGGLTGAGIGLSLSGTNVQLGDGATLFYTDTPSVKDFFLYQVGAANLTSLYSGFGATTATLGEAGFAATNAAGSRGAEIKAEYDSASPNPLAKMQINSGTGLFNVFSSDQTNGYRVRDDIHQRGLVEHANYSANKTDLSYITPAWLKAQSGYNASVAQYFTHDASGNFAWVNI